MTSAPGGAIRAAAITALGLSISNMCSTLAPSATGNTFIHRAFQRTDLVPWLGLYRQVVADDRMENLLVGDGVTPGIVRVGETVRRPKRAFSATVQAFLSHLHS